jgi:hypothetical protein
MGLEVDRAAKRIAVLSVGAAAFIGPTVLSAVAKGPPLPQAVTVHLQVIEATKTSTVFDSRIGNLHGSLLGYSGANLLDELEVRVEVRRPALFDILNHSQKLKVTVRKIDAGSVVLRVAIDAFKFGADVTYRKNGATVVVGKKTGPTTGLFLAVAPVMDTTPSLNRPPVSDSIGNAADH